jgi:DNA repair protein SbcC/Rad50
MINSIALTNWKSHTKSEFEFQPGTNVLVGSMGAGKSSILQAISFALFGTFSELKHRDLKISDVITRGAEQKISEITLSINSPQNKLFEIKRKIDAKKTISEGSVRDKDNKLIAGPQTTQINEFVKKEFGVDDEIFLRTVYAMQNDIDMILKLSPKDRKKKIDELMGLNKFEKARNNCVTLRNRTIKQKQDSEAFLESIGLENLNKKITVAKNNIEVLKSKQLGLQSELSKKKLEKDTARIKLLDFREKLSESNKLEERKRNILKLLFELDEKLKNKQIERSKQELEKEIEEIKNNIRMIQRNKINFSDQNNKSQLQLMSADKKLALSENKINGIEEKLKKILELKEELAKQKISDLTNEISELKKELDLKKDAKQTNLAQLNEHRKHLEQLLLAESHCPVCSTLLNEDNKSRIISERKENISKILYKNTELSEIISAIENRYEDLKQIFEKNRYVLEELSKENELKHEQNKLKLDIDENRIIVIESKSILDHSKKNISELDKEIENLNIKLSSLNDEKYLYEIKDQHSRAKAELELVEDEFKHKKVSKEIVDEQDNKFQQLLKQVQEVETTLSNFEDLLSDKVKQLSELNSQQNKAEEFKQKIKSLEEKAGFLDKFRAALEATQLTLRDDLILAVNEVMSSVWIEIYPYDKWLGVRLSSTEQDYNLQLKEAGGDWVSVTGFASGGERMLASLAVRIAFARVLAPSLSLLILDEPTHNLDDKAISTFIDVVQNKVSDFLDQIFIVTHEEKLAENADNVIRI